MNDFAPATVPIPPNGQAAAAILSAGGGVASLGVLALAADASPAINRALQFYVPSGALSGVTTVAIIVWLAVWGVLTLRWRGRTVAIGRINLAALLLLAAGILLTFPPFMDALQGK
jgi:hypothetical protein